MEEPQIKVYVKIDSAGRIVDINSSVFLANVSDWVEINSGNGDKYAHAQNIYLEKGLTDNQLLYNYKIVNDKLIERTDSEKQLDYLLINKNDDISWSVRNQTCRTGIPSDGSDGDTCHVYL